MSCSANFFTEPFLVDFPSFSWPSLSLTISDQDAAHLFYLAAILTDPVCKAHEYYTLFVHSDSIYPDLPHIDRVATKVAFFAHILFFGSLAIISTLPGVALRYLIINLQDNPFNHLEGRAREKKFGGNEFSLLSWNICCSLGGYVYTDAGVTNWPSRIDAIVDKIKEQDADVLCLYELFDAEASMKLYKELKDQYAHFYINIGPRTIGASSGLFVASKFPIHDPHFVAFPKDMLVGRTQFSEKGIFSFGVGTPDQPKARIFTTHLQHSEEVDFETDQEINARKEEMDLVMGEISKIRGQTVILTGDLNLDDEEYEESLWHNQFEKKVTSSKKTWGGDAFCAGLVEKRPSPPLNLDHTLLLKDSGARIETRILPTGFQGDQFKPAALSDHSGLHSIIRV